MRIGILTSGGDAPGMNARDSALQQGLPLYYRVVGSWEYAVVYQRLLAWRRHVRKWPLEA